MLAKELVARRAVPEKAATDAFHISVAAVHNIDYLLSWNCRHIANAEMQEAIHKLCDENGFWFPRSAHPRNCWGINSMYKDEIVDEVRKARDDFARHYDYDISRIYDAIRILQSESSRPVVSRVTKNNKLSHKEQVNHELESVS